MNFIFNTNVCRVCMRNDQSSDLWNNKDLLEKFIFTTSLAETASSLIKKLIRHRTIQKRKRRIGCSENEETNTIIQRNINELLNDDSENFEFSTYSQHANAVNTGKVPPPATYSGSMSRYSLPKSFASVSGSMQFSEMSGRTQQLIRIRSPSANAENFKCKTKIANAPVGGSNKCSEISAKSEQSITIHRPSANAEECFSKPNNLKKNLINVASTAITDSAEVGKRIAHNLEKKILGDKVPILHRTIPRYGEPVDRYDVFSMIVATELRALALSNEEELSLEIDLLKMIRTRYPKK